MTFTFKSCQLLCILILFAIYTTSTALKHETKSTESPETPLNTKFSGNSGRYSNEIDEIDVENNKLLPSECGRDLSFKSPEGNRTDLDEFSWVALLEYRTPLGLITGCGGALINNRYILTAAHCVKDLPYKWVLIGVNLGEYDTRTAIDCISNGDDDDTYYCWDSSTFIQIEEQIHHENYYLNSANGEFDIALIRLAREVPFSNAIAPICLPSKPTAMTKFYVAGWGRTGHSEGNELKLKSILELIPRDDCTIVKNKSLDLYKDQICAGGSRIDSNTCIGDSGGPLMTVEKRHDRTMRWTVAGIFAIGGDICERNERGYMGVYINVFDYISWILGHIRP